MLHAFQFNVQVLVVIRNPAVVQSGYISVWPWYVNYLNHLSLGVDERKVPVFVQLYYCC